MIPVGAFTVLVLHIVGSLLEIAQIVYQNEKPITDFWLTHQIYLGGEVVITLIALISMVITWGYHR